VGGVGGVSQRAGGAQRSRGGLGVGRTAMSLGVPHGRTSRVDAARTASSTSDVVCVFRSGFFFGGTLVAPTVSGLGR
jgi:hypothetical protein